MRICLQGKEKRVWMKKRKHFETKGQIEARKKSEADRRYMKLSRELI